MKGNVVEVNRPQKTIRVGAGPFLPGEHGIEESRTPYATLDNGKKVEIPENLIRDYYNRVRITESLIQKLKNDLNGKEIEYNDDEDGNGIINGPLDQYIQ